MKITFLGAGSTVFAKNVLGDIISMLQIPDIELSLYDIDPIRLDDSFNMLNIILKNSGRIDGRILKYGQGQLKNALQDADFVVNAVQVGGYEPCTVTDFEIPKKFGLRQTIADTLGIGGLFRALRTVPVMKQFADTMEQVCPRALLLNYTNPMSILTGYMNRFTNIKTLGLCHSVQTCVPSLLDTLKMTEYKDNCRWRIAGINHQSWLLQIEDMNGKDLYPEIKQRSLSGEYDRDWDLVRHKIMHTFGFYNTESSEHTSEYSPYFIKSRYPELIEQYKIPLDEYPRRCVKQIEDWKNMRESLVGDTKLVHEPSREYAASIIRAAVTNEPVCVYGNVINKGRLINNLPENACVEVPCMINNTGVNPCIVGDLPEQCAALNRTNINMQLLAIEASATQKKEYIYMSALLDPHTSAELSIDDTIKLCDELIAAHGEWLPKFH